MRWRLQQLRGEGSENPAQVLSTGQNAIRRLRMVMRGLPHRELTEEGKRLIGSIQHEAAQQTKQAPQVCSCLAHAVHPGLLQPYNTLSGSQVVPTCMPPHMAHKRHARSCMCRSQYGLLWLLQQRPRPHTQSADQPVPDPG
jgi:hypothetical protein